MRRDEEPDAPLIERARRGDPDAWRALVRRHTPMVFRLARRMLRSDAEAEDAAQEAFMRMYASLDSYDAARPLTAWLGRIVYHACLKRLGKAERRLGDTAEPDALAALPDGTLPSPEAMAAGHETDAVVAHAIDQLAAQDRLLVMLRYREGLADGEVAEAAGMNVNTVRTRLFRARQVLRRLLEPLLGGGARGGGA